MANEDKIQKLKELKDLGIFSEKEYRKKINNILNPREQVNWNKFFHGFFNIVDPVEWLKTIHNWLNLRNVVIGLVLFSLVYNFAYKKGFGNKTVKFDLRGQEANIRLNEHYLKIEKDGTANVLDNNGNIVKTIKAKDIPELSKALKPVGFILKPIGVVGASVGQTLNSDQTQFSVEAGGGISWFKIHSITADAFITNKGIYPLAISKKVKFLGSENSSIGVGVGKGWQEAETRVMGYLKWNW